MTSNANSTMPTFMDRRRIGRGLAAFAALTVAGLGVLFVFTLRGDMSDVARNLSAGFLILAALGTMADLLIGALRYQIFLRRIRPGTPLALPIKADLANRFIGAMTPSQTGGGPAQVFILHRGGIPIPEALSFLMINFVSTLVFFLVAGGLTAWGLRDHFTQGAVQYLVQWGFVAFLGGLVFMVVGLVRPDLIVRLVSALVRRLEASPRGWARVVAKAGHIHFILYVAPTPGGSGIAELSTGALMAVLLPTNLLGPFTLAYRFFLLYLPAAAGAAVMAQALGPRRNTQKERKERAATVGAVASALVLLAAGSAVLPTSAAAQEAGPLSPVPVMSVRALADDVVAEKLSRKKSQLRDALAEGVAARRDESATSAFTRAVEIGRYLVAAAPDDADAHYLLSIALGLRLETAGLRDKIRMGGETRREAETALGLDPSHAGAHHVMGRLHAGTMRMRGVARFVAQRLLGAEALAGVSWEQAERHFISARNAEPDNPRHSMELGVLYIDTDRTALAFVELTRAMRAPVLEPADSLAVVRAGTVLASLSCVEERCGA